MLLIKKTLLLIVLLFATLLLRAQPSLYPTLMMDEGRRIAVDEYFKGEKMIQIDSNYTLYVIFMDTLNFDLRVKKSTFYTEDIELEAKGNETVRIMFQYKRDIIILPFEKIFFNLFAEQTLNFGSVPIHDHRKKVRRHRFFPPVDTANIKTPYYYLENISPPIYPVEMTPFKLNSMYTFTLFSDREKIKKSDIDPSKIKKCKVLWIVQDYGFSEEDDDENTGKTGGINSTYFLQLYVIEDFKAYKKECRDYLQMIEDIYNEPY